MGAVHQRLVAVTENILKDESHEDLRFLGRAQNSYIFISMAAGGILLYAAIIGGIALFAVVVVWFSRRSTERAFAPPAGGVLTLSHGALRRFTSASCTGCWVSHGRLQDRI